MRSSQDKLTGLRADAVPLPAPSPNASDFDDSPTFDDEEVEAGLWQQQQEQSL